MINKNLALFFLILFLSSCSIFSDEDLTYIAPSPEVKNNKIKLDVDFKKSINSGNIEVFSKITPVIAYDKIFLASYLGIVSAYDIKTNKKVWQKDLRKLKQENLIFDDFYLKEITAGLNSRYNQLFLATQNGEIYSLDVKTGDVLYSKNINSEVLAPFAVAEGAVLIHSAKGELISLSADTGKINWQYQYPNPSLSLRGQSKPIVFQGGVILAQSNGVLSVLSLQNGNVFWQLDLAQNKSGTELERITDIDSTPVILNETLYIATFSGELEAIDLKDAGKIWQRNLSIYKDIKVFKDNLIVTDKDNNIYAISSLSGEILWQNQKFQGRDTNVAQVVDNNLVFGDFEGYVYVISGETGELLGKKHLANSGFRENFLYQDDFIYAFAAEGTLFKFNLTKRE